jgi:hypothetical protein
MLIIKSQNLEIKCKNNKLKQMWMRHWTFYQLNKKWKRRIWSHASLEIDNLYDHYI